MAERLGINYKKENFNLNLVSAYYTENISVQHYPTTKRKKIDSGFYGLFRVIEGTGILSTVENSFTLKQDDFIFVSFNELVAHTSTSKNYKFYSFYFYTDINLTLNQPMSYKLSSEETDNYEKTISQLYNGDFLSILKASAYFMINISNLLKRFDKSTNASLYTKEIKNVILYIHQNINENLKTEDLAKMLHVCNKYFTSLFIAHTGLSPKQYIIKTKIERACHLLKYSSKSVAEISDELNFFSPSYFIYTFNKHQGKTPAQYRKEYLTDTEQF